MLCCSLILRSLFILSYFANVAHICFGHSLLFFFWQNEGYDGLNLIGVCSVVSGNIYLNEPKIIKTCCSNADL